MPPKFTPAGRQVAVRTFFCGDGQAVEEVEDTGVGIALERIEATFDASGRWVTR